MTTCSFCEGTIEGRTCFFQTKKCCADCFTKQCKIKINPHRLKFCLECKKQFFQFKATQRLCSEKCKARVHARYVKEKRLEQMKSQLKAIQLNKTGGLQNGNTKET